MTRRQHQDAHDALAIHFLAVLHQGNVAWEAIGRLHDERGRPRMQPHLVAYQQILFGPLFWHARLLLE